MPNRREPLNLMSFVGGLNLRRSQFELAEDESPDLLNVDIDPRGGFYTRKGWQRWNADDIVDTTTTAWQPVNAWSHVTAGGSQYVYVVNGSAIGLPPPTLAEPFDNFGAWTVTGTPVLVAGRTGTAAECNSFDDQLEYTITTPSADLTIGTAFLTTNLAAQSNVWGLRLAGADEQRLVVNSTGSLALGLAGIGIFGATSAAGVITANTWNYIEVKIHMHNTLGTVEIRVNGTTVATSTNVDTLGTGLPNRLRLEPGAGGAITLRWDDLYLSTSPSSPFYGGLQSPIYRADATAHFAALSGVGAAGIPHGADFTAWGDDVYIATGRFGAAVRVNPAGTVTTLAGATWSEIDAPTANTMPHAEYVTTHAGYLFVACTNEADGNHFSRIRWSHPLVPDSFRDDDFIDIDAGGGRITGIMSYDDHLLIFKTSTMWALYGSDEASWQLREVSSKIGCPAVTAMTRSETTAYFASSTDLGGMYAYQGQQPIYLSEPLRPAFEELLNFDHVFVSWCAQRLWVSVPWIKGIGSTTDPTSTFVFDPTIGQGAWTLYRCDFGALGLAIDNSDVGGRYPLAAFWSDAAAAMVLLEYINDAYDSILEETVLGTQSSLPDNPDAPYIVTNADAEILLTGQALSGQAFDSYYRTRWLHAGWPERKKSWRRPTFICREVPQSTDLIVETYHDYDETNIHRSRTLNLRVKGGAYWTEDGFDDPDGAGFDWTEGGEDDPSGRGADWGAQRGGSQLVRSGSQGLARAIQMRVRASPNTQRQRWGVDGIVAKFVMRRFQ